MFRYVEGHSLLHRLNPVVKFFSILALTVFVSLTFSVLLPLAALVIVLGTLVIGGDFGIREIFGRMRLFLAAAAAFMLSMLLLKGIGNAAPEVRFFFLGWKRADLVFVCSLGLRILTFAAMTMAFVMTTSPGDLVLSLILQLKVPCVHGYAALAAYRFLPTLHAQTKQIRLAQEIRGVKTKRGLLSRLKAPFQTFLPLMCLAARRGGRVAIAMETRGLGASKKRTYLHRTRITKEDVSFILAEAIVFAALGGILYHFHFLRFGVVFAG